MASLTLSGRKKAHATDLNVLLAEGVREEEVVRGLTVAATTGVVEKELQGLLEREVRRVEREVANRDRKKGEEEERTRMASLAFDREG